MTRCGHAPITSIALAFADIAGIDVSGSREVFCSKLLPGDTGKKMARCSYPLHCQVSVAATGNYLMKHGGAF